MGHCIYCRVKQRKLTALKVPTQCPRVLMLQVGGKQGKALETEDVASWKVECWEYATDGGSRALGLSLEFGRAALRRNFDNFGRDEFWRKF